MDAFEPKSDFLRVLRERGFVHQCSDWAGLDAKAASGELVAYIGFDATGPSLHVGHLMQIYMLHWLQENGGKPIALMGGGTTMVGDPSGKDESRKLLSVEQIESNKANIRKSFDRFLRFGEAKTDAIMADNAEWLTKLNYIEFLRDVGRHFSVNRMLSMDSVKMRLEREQELSFIEFNYMCLQSYDFVELNRRYGCALQMGGSDQWGNIVMGADLGRRLGTPQLYALTSPLITTASGAKMGKTAAGAVWLDASMLSPYDYWQFWRNTEDADVERFLKLFTLLPMDEIARLGALQGADINEAKKTLATEATALLHGREAAEAAAETARKTFEEGVAAETLPSIDVSASEFDAGIGALSAFVRARLVASTGEARRQIRGGGLRVNDEALADEKALIGRDALRDGVVKLSLGRKKHVLLRAI
ncbi:MAG: tyrosine--tRNA ligase [Pseudomonadota bacterium]|nr:tyrosine--tRNA ligase [Pseudomonadota bacterium]